jgi:hypothetical protein
MFKSLHCEQIGKLLSIWLVLLKIGVSLRLSEIDTDAEGICSHSLRSILENWPAGKPKPKVLYTVPVRLAVMDSICFFVP